MSEEFKIEIVNPEQSFLSKEDVTEVIVPAYEGEMGILKDHIPLITFLRPGIIEIKDQNERKYFVEDGTVEFSNNTLLILTSTANELSNIDKNLLSTIKNQVEKKLSEEEITDKERYLLSYKLDTLKNINQ